ncbi:MAG: hypothetical protein Q8L81_07210 [Bacteroidota bacterium]|nr:hypothetical protein [Bacteroidota bacterium]
MMNNFYILFIVALLTSCSQKAEEVSVTALTDTAIVNLDTAAAVKTETELVVKQDSEKEEEGEFATYFIVIADTGKDYYFLDKELFMLNKKLKLKIDSMERIYNKKKNLIALPENHEDEIYAGEYYPRRHPSTELSLEYLNFYKEKAPEKTIALVAGIFGTKEEGEKVTASIKSLMPNAHVLKARVFIGCMH